MDKLRLIKDSLEELKKEYQKNPNNFFNEHDFHHIFFNVVYSKLGDESKLLFHPEYPTRKRFVREKEKDEEYEKDKHSFSLDKNKGKRGHYDFVVLKEGFYEDNKDDINKLSNKTVLINKKINYKYIDTAIEFKYTTGYLDINQIKFDLFKLNEAEEVDNKILVVFLKKEVPNSKEISRDIQNLNKGSVEIFKTDDI